MVHGDLKGVRDSSGDRTAHSLTDSSTKANILVNQAGRACLADFGLLTIALDPSNITTSGSFHQGGTCRWMAPELFDPSKFGFKDHCPTKNSDRYALGMVIYEVLSGQIPFAGHSSFVVPGIVLEGERPAKPQGAKGRWFTDDVWSILSYCWNSNPGDRAKTEVVLSCLEGVARTWTPPSPRSIVDPPTTDRSTWSVDSSPEGSLDDEEDTI